MCVDNSRLRMRRLKEVMKQYTPKSYTTEEKVHYKSTSGVRYCESVLGDVEYDKVCVLYWYQ